MQFLEKASDIGFGNGDVLGCDCEQLLGSSKLLLEPEFGPYFFVQGTGLQHVLRGLWGHSTQAVRSVLTAMPVQQEA